MLKENEIMKGLEDKRKIENMDKRIKFIGFRIFNTSWAKNRNTGKKDTVNVALFIEFEDRCGNRLYWIPSNKESDLLIKKKNDVEDYNKTFDNQATIYHSLRDEEDGGSFV